MRLTIPEFSLVALIGVSGSGKSTFGRKHFLPTEVLSSDTYRGAVSNSETDQSASNDAFEALHHMLEIRLRRKLLTVVDATNVQTDGRAPLNKIAAKYHALKVAIVLDVSPRICQDRNADRPDRQFGDHVVRSQHANLRRTLGQLKAERWHKVYVLRDGEIDAAEIVREPLYNNRPAEHGPFDIIGDIHGCYDELVDLLTKLGWGLDPVPCHPDGRKLVFLGDLVDRGPNPVPVLNLVMAAHEAGTAICVPGNHDIKFAKALQGRQVTLNHGLDVTMAQMASESQEYKNKVAGFITDMVSHYMLDDGKLCVAHAGLREDMQGRGSRIVRDFALYGETTGEIDEFGLPVRYEWARNYKGKPLVVYGHTPVPEPEWLNNTIDIDTGCCFGGNLTALRYPEKELVSVPARKVYAEPSRPLAAEASSDSLDVLEIQDVLGRRSIETALSGFVAIREENAIAALEVMSRFAADPKWLVYLPPTMSPCATSDRDGYLEYPTEAFSYFRDLGVETVVCEEKHMGSRAVAVVCRSEEAAKKRFGVLAGQGVVTTRTGRRFFDDDRLDAEIVARLVAAGERSGLFDELSSDWFLLDLELMPWSAKAVSLLKEQYAPVGAAAVASTSVWASLANLMAERNLPGAEDICASAQMRAEAAVKFRSAYRRYCWHVNQIDDYKLAPFHLLASEGAVHANKDHGWHMCMLEKLSDADPKLIAKTPWRTVNLADEKEVSDACAWWENLVASGGEGMVVKPWQFTVQRDRRLIQPAVKCRGPEYLRIIYGPDYLDPKNLEQLRKRGLNRKRSLAAREFALGVEAMQRFVDNQPFSKVHECVFGILALESEPVDPRL